MARQFIYHMQGLSKTYPGNRKILEDIKPFAEPFPLEVVPVDIMGLQGGALIELTSINDILGTHGSLAPIYRRRH